MNQKSDARQLWDKNCNNTPSHAAQHGIPSDRFAHEIVAILMSSCAMRSRQMNANPFYTM
jgi:hypothetical protein